MKNMIIKYGVSAGVVIIGMFIITINMKNFDSSLGEWIGYSTMIIALSSIYFAVKSHRDNVLNGQIDFINAFKIGLYITLVASLIYVLAWMILSNTIAKDLMSEYFQNSIQQIRDSNLTEAEMTQKIVEIENFRELYKNPFVKMGMTFLEIFPVGFVISLITSLILKKK